MSSDLPFKLSTLNNQIGKPHFRQIFLFLQCMDLSGQALDNAKTLTEIYRLISDSHHNTEAHTARYLLQYILQFVCVKGAETLGAVDSELTIAAKHLAFASLLVRICQRLDSEEYHRFRVSICFGVLDYDTDTIDSCEDLMGKLFKKKKIGPDNVKLLLDWLPHLGREDLTEKVKEYEKSYEKTRKEMEEEKTLSASLSRTLSTQEESNSSEAGENRQFANGSVPAVPTALSIQQMTEKNGVTEADLHERVAEPHLYEIANFIGDDWKSLVQPLGLSDQAVEASQALKKWWTDWDSEAKYMSLVQAFLGVRKVRQAEKVFELLKDGVPPSQNETTDEEDKFMRYCSGDCFKEEEEAEPQPTLQDGSWGSIRPSKLWDIQSFPELRVHFLNPAVLTDKKKPWKYGRHQNPLTTDLILSWACTWNTPGQQYPRLPDHDEIDPTNAQIKVWFDTRRICESKVGRDALTVSDPEQPTMILNLYGMSDAAQKSYVIHEFGHVLGLDHEHQRSQFWNVLNSKDKKGKNLTVGIEKMKKRDSYGYQACEQHLRKNWTEGEMDLSRPEYDPESIMHYWFDKRWLILKYRDLGHVRTTDDLSDRQKKVLEGVHARDVTVYDNLLPKGPSNLDYQALKDAYKH